MNHPILQWLNRYIGRPDALALIAVLILAGLVFYYFGHMLTPVFVSIIIAYLLQGVINRFETWGLPHRLSVLLVYLATTGIVVIAMVTLLPILWRQLTNLLTQWPGMVNHMQVLLSKLYQNYPKLISPDTVQTVIANIKDQSLTYGQKVLSISLSSLSSVIVFCVYFILVPLLVYFFLMDKNDLLNNFQNYLPKQKKLVAKVWFEVYDQLGDYVRGKFLEAVIIGVAMFVQFILMDLNYAFLMAVLVGLSVIIPYVGAVLVTIPLLIIGFLQWGMSPYFGYFLLIYAVLIALDANVLVPLIFSEAIHIHPVSIILAILIFGGLFGFWGVFFAIPLASLVKAVANALSEQQSAVDI